MVGFDHYTLGYLTFAFMSLTMLSGAFIFLNKNKKSFWVKMHIVLSVITYILMVLTILLVR
ncbi:membrane protein [Thermococcus barophilus]|uniref:Uncharacterized protein n=2 Tax=Thermococcus barophilus TaxID=55802 RepID=A0A0S1XCY3_THEBA|nr:membrane protein [Thermococcus barophilus]ADT84443.1 hypothetical protein TERMP_01468 [Thermococcus barophilus MP]ALM75630.1 hypothetical protein TBCH5v1_1720 [Thermococcus barophilus]